MATGGGNQWDVFSECVNSIILKCSFLLFFIEDREKSNGISLSSISD